MNKQYPLFVLTMFSIAIPISSGQVTLVHFGGDMVSSNVQFQSELSTAQTEAALDRDFNGDGNKDGRVIFRALDLNTPWLASSGSYSGPSFYGGVTIFSETLTGTFRVRASSVINNTNGDYLRPISDMGAQGTADDPILRAGAMVFLFQIDTPGGGKFSTGDSLTHGQGSGGSVFNSTHRFVVRSNGQFYISETVGGTLGTIDPSTINWAQYDIGQGEQNMLVPGSAGVSGSLTFDTIGSTLDQIDFIGVVGINTGNSPSTPTWAPSIGTFTYTAIPEPSTYAGIAGLLMLAAALIRRRYCKVA